MAERDLAGEAGEDLEAEERDQVDADVRELLRAEVADEPRQEHEHDRREQEERDLDRLEAAEAEAAHTRLAIGLPKSPAGRTSRTTRMIRSAAGMRSSPPMKSM